MDGRIVNRPALPFRSAESEIEFLKERFSTMNY
jgi:hypothetical protein